MDQAIRIRDAELPDFEAITTIYNDVLLHGTAIYNEHPASLAERIQVWRERLEQRYPTIVVEVGGQVRGYASFGNFRQWPGYRYTVEGSIHLACNARGRGLGTALLTELVERARGIGKHMMVAGVDSSNTASLRFLERFGFQEAGVLREVGYKFGRYLDLVLLQYCLEPEGTHVSTEGV